MAQTEWEPSDELLMADQVATAKVGQPFDPPNLSEAGIVLPDDWVSDEALEAAAVVALAELCEDDDAEGEPGDVEDDDEIDEDDGGEPMEEV